MENPAPLKMSTSKFEVSTVLTHSKTKVKGDEEEIVLVVPSRSKSKVENTSGGALKTKSRTKSEENQDSISKQAKRHTTKKSFQGHLNLTTADKATRRVLAPYIRTVRKNLKPTLEKKTRSPSFYLQKKPSTLIKNLAAYLSESVDLPVLLHETSDILQNVTRSDGVTLYMVDVAEGEIFNHPKNVLSSRHKVNWPIGEHSTVASYVAYNRDYIVVEDLIMDTRFPDGIGWFDPNIKAVLCVPVVTPDDEIIAVIELYKEHGDADSGVPFEKVDLQIVVTVTGWMGAAIHQNQQRLALQKHQELNEYLLELTRVYFSEIVPMEKMISQIVLFAKEMLGAERGSFFIVDHECDELVADLFDEGVDTDTGEMLHRKKQKIRFNKERGIAGTVAKTGVAINIRDAYEDPRFNKEVDVMTGFITKSILCAPINGKEGVIGVIQLVNKLNGSCFTNTDEKIFATFSVYCTLTLSYSRQQEVSRKANLVNAVDSEMLSYHFKPCIHDRNRMLHAPLMDELPSGFHKFSWYLTGYEEHLSQLVYYMLTDLNVDCFDEKLLIIFILSIKKGYRKNPYHSFEHAFNVCHCMYLILKRHPDVFTPVEIRGLLIAAICHDIDHQGYTNNYQQLINSELSQIYPTSCLENHHFQTTLRVIQVSKVFANMSTENSKEIIDEIYAGIMATDLAFYFHCRPKIMALIANEDFDWKINEHRVLAKCVVMTACDLSAQTKPFPVAKRITEFLYREMYHQGDMESDLGYNPLPMLDRNKQDTIPNDQTKFIDLVVLPCLEMLAKLLPNTAELHAFSRDLRNHWEEIIQLQGKKVWKPEESTGEKSAV